MTRTSRPNSYDTLRIGVHRFAMSPFRECYGGEDTVYGVVADRYKWIRAAFLQTMTESGSHWLSRPIVPNVLAPGVDIYAGGG